MAQYSTNFGSYTTGVKPSDWTERWVTTDSDWTVKDEAAAIGGKYLDHNVTYTGFGFNPRMLSWDLPGTPTDVDVIVRWRHNASDTSVTALGPMVVLRGSGTTAGNDEQGYILEQREEGSSNDKLLIRKWVGGGLVSILAEDATVSNFAPGVWYNFRFQVSGSAIKAKYWEDKSAEPATWWQEVTDSDIAGAGWVGVGEPSKFHNIEIDFVSIGTNGDTPPSLPFLSYTAPVIALSMPALPPVMQYGSLYGVHAISFEMAAQSPSVGFGMNVPALSLTLTPQAPRVAQSFHALIQKTPIFLCDLTGDADATTDLRIPISSFQSIMRSGTPSIVTVVTPSVEQAAEIANRLNGDIVVYYGFRNENTGEILVSEIARANLEDARTDQGGRNQSITLRGTKQQTFSNPISRTLTGVSYRAVIEGKRRFRTDLDTELRPGDTAVIGAESLVVATITYTIGQATRVMEISE